ncbi:hypothetical protein [Nocardia vermiculata]|uniref:N-acetyltransferase domain-containing protein n=1 Tax=Nocardia vermiculata TaxID=257274 RepID=A0A846XSN4_9NOCA|nr:hypothetical protein [Nocardia vermiculata]NKY48890.1 hypothetical protein [Nocardia vermiculata]
MDDNTPTAEGETTRPDRQLIQRREQAWSNYQQACAELAGTRIRANLDGWKRFLRILPGAAVDQAERRRDEIRSELARHCVGADAHVWGVLSGGDTGTFGGLFGLEHTIEQLTQRYAKADPHWVRNLRGIARSATDARPLAAEGDGTVVAELTDRVLQAVRMAPDDEARRRLVVHLPGGIRPVPPDPVLLNEQHGPVVVQYDIYASTIKLDNIDVLLPLRRMGLGTATLQHLCHTADAHGMHIVAQLVPTFRDDDSAVPILARWFRGHGFDVTERLGGRVVRAPESIR